MTSTCAKTPKGDSANSTYQCHDTTITAEESTTAVTPMVTTTPVPQQSPTLPTIPYMLTPNDCAPTDQRMTFPSTGLLIAVWTIDCDGDRQECIQEFSTTLRRTVTRRDLCDRGHLVRLLEHLTREQPQLLWINLRDYPPLYKAAKRERVAIDHLLTFVHRQKNLGGTVVMEGKADAEIFNEPGLQVLIGPEFRRTFHRWFN